MIINLENLNGLPQEFIKRLNTFDGIFKSCNYFEEYESNTDIKQLTIKIDKFCQNNQIIGYHYTNAIKDDILKNGLLVRTGEDIRIAFVERHFHLFTEEEQATILIAWKDYFGETAIQYRDSRIFFNFTLNGLQNQGADLLLNYYGGEQVYFPLYRLPQIGEKLKRMGTSMILKCILTPNNIETFWGNPDLYNYPWGRIAISSYHRLRNRDAYVEDQDGFQRTDVKPENIEIIINESSSCRATK